MTESEAIKKLKQHFEYLKHAWKPHPDYETMDAIGYAIQALEKQIPKKVIKWANGTEHCPACDCDNSCVGYGVCIDCGQKLDWSDENE